MALFSECTDSYAQKLLDTADIVREALFSECTDSYAQKLLDTADIVREAIFRQLLLRLELGGHQLLRRWTD